MNRRRTVKPHLSFGSVLLLVTAAVIVAAAGVFHAYVKNRQINVAREIQEAEDRISQHRMDIQTSEVLLAQQLNRIRLRNCLLELNSDLREIRPEVLREIDGSAPDRSSPDSEVAGMRRPSDRSAVAGGP